MSFKSTAPALAAAFLFGASTPLAKLLVGDVQPLLLAGLLYVGSGLGLGTVFFVRSIRSRNTDPLFNPAHIPRAELAWLLGAIVVGGMLGPALLMAGLARIGAPSAALLLNMEGVLTAIIAWVVFNEATNRQIVLGMVLIILGSVLLSWEPGALAWSMGAVLIVGACLCWAVDNNLTRRVSANDPILVAGLKGLVAGTCNTSLALFAGATLPPATTLGAALLVGFAGYGLSLALFVVALRLLGTARTAAYFSVAPLIGVLIAFALWPQIPAWTFWLAAPMMAVGVWLHLAERHEHEHTHEPMRHTHRHRHDEHHQHEHDFAWDGREPHVHPHAHIALTHMHPHYPDIHHRHGH